MISVLILTRDEVRNLPGCLASVAWSDDVHVLDSFSTDGTQAVAAAEGAHVTERVFDNWSAHQNWALANLPFRYPWVFYLDADERATPELRDAMLAAVRSHSGNSADGSPVAYRIQRRDFLLGTWLRRTQNTAFYTRLFRPGCMRYERLVNPVSIASGPVGELSGYLDHYPFSKGIGQWVERHNSYSSFEAEQTLANRAGHTQLSVRTALFDKDFATRRFHQKEIFYRLPGRPFIKFLYLYVARWGFLDGRAGFTYACLQSFYDYLIVLKTRELERKRAGLST